MRSGSIDSKRHGGGNTGKVGEARVFSVENEPTTNSGPNIRQQKPTLKSPTSCCRYMVSRHTKERYKMGNGFVNVTGVNGDV